MTLMKLLVKTENAFSNRKCLTEGDDVRRRHHSDESIPHVRYIHLFYKQKQTLLINSLWGTTGD